MDVETRVWTRGRGKGNEWGDWDGHIYITMCKIDS